jgi:hypothetical protein
MALIPVQNTFVHFGCAIAMFSNCSRRSFSAPGRQTQIGYDLQGDAKAEHHRFLQLTKPEVEESSNADGQEDDDFLKMDGQSVVSTEEGSVSSASSETPSTESEFQSRKQWHKDFRPSKKHREAYRRWKGQLEAKLFEDPGSFDIEAIQVPDWVAPMDHVKVGLLQRTRAHFAFVKSTMG